MLLLMIKILYVENMIIPIIRLKTFCPRDGKLFPPRDRKLSPKVEPPVFTGIKTVNKR
jgi:hypothetical protein